MNLTRPSVIVITWFFQFWLILRRLLPKSKCKMFTAQVDKKSIGVNIIYVINLDREPRRWFKMKKELSRILDSSGIEILKLTERHVAVDANQFLFEPVKDAEIDPYYTLADQLFVEPQPSVFPTRLELNSPIRMSRAEIAVARSHINVWKKVVIGKCEYSLILEDDTWFHTNFTKKMNEAWNEILTINDAHNKFDILYVSFLEVKHGAPKIFLSSNVFQPERGLWHLSGYILSREGAKKLLRLLPCRGPIDLWINHHFEKLNVIATKRSLINQRRDVKSTNSYSILSELTKIGAINSEGASLFNIRPIEYPVFVFGIEDSGQSSVAMALSMLGYRCCSDFKDIPNSELELLLKGSEDRVFDAYVNIGSLYLKVKELRTCYPKAKFIFTSSNELTSDLILTNVLDDLKGADVALLYLNEINKWKVICEHLRCAPPSCSFPVVKDIGQRKILDNIILDKVPKCLIPKRDNSPWLIMSRSWWRGIRVSSPKETLEENCRLVRITDHFEYHNTQNWILRSDTFTDNLALFRPSNVEFSSGNGALLSIKKEPLGVRDYSAASLSSINQYLYGKFEAIIQASNAPGVVTGIFLHRNSPRQEIDIEIAGNQPSRLLVNVFYNPGGEGANFDYGYRGAPTYIELGFDASKSFHRFTIEWGPCEIRWLVDDELVHSRVIWDPTPIPNLPMTFHINSWLTRSIRLAGRISNGCLPTTTIVRQASLEANSIITLPVVNV